MVPITRDDWTEIVSESVEGKHSFLAVSAEEQCLNGLRLNIVDDGPKTASSNPTSHGLAHE